MYLICSNPPDLYHTLTLQSFPVLSMTVSLDVSRWFPFRAVLLAMTPLCAWESLRVNTCHRENPRARRINPTSPHPCRSGKLFEPPASELGQPLHPLSEVRTVTEGGIRLVEQCGQSLPRGSRAERILDPGPLRVQRIRADRLSGLRNRLVPLVRRQTGTERLCQILGLPPGPHSG